MHTHNAHKGDHQKSLTEIVTYHEHNATKTRTHIYTRTHSLLLKPCTHITHTLAAAQTECLRQTPSSSPRCPRTGSAMPKCGTRQYSVLFVVFGGSIHVHIFTSLSLSICYIHSSLFSLADRHVCVYVWRWAGKQKALHACWML